MRRRLRTAPRSPTLASAPSLESVETESFGMAMGDVVTVEDAYLSWVDLRNKVGALLIGMEPILSGDGNGYHIVAGPVDRIARAEEICGYVQRAGPAMPARSLLRLQDADVAVRPDTADFAATLRHNGG